MLELLKSLVFAVVMGARGNGRDFGHDLWAG